MSLPLERSGGDGIHAEPGSTVFEQIFDLAPVALLVVNSRGRIKLFNENARQLFGYSVEEVLDAPVEALIGSNLRARHMEFVKQCFADPTPRIMGDGRRLFAIHKDGREFPIEVGLKPIPLDGERLAMASIIDITRRMSLEARFQTAVEAAPVAMIMVDATRRIVNINLEARRMFGYETDEILGREIEILVPEEIRHQHPHLVDQYLSHPTSRRMGQGRRLFGVDKGGRRIPIEVGLSPIHTEDGAYVVTSIIDITRQLRDEKRFRDAVEAAPNAMLIVEASGTITLVNEQCEDLFQYTKEELIGQSVEMLVPEAVRALHAGHVKDYANDPVPRAMGQGRDLFGRRKDGGLFPVEVGLRPQESRPGDRGRQGAGGSGTRPQSVGQAPLLRRRYPRPDTGRSPRTHPGGVRLRGRARVDPRKAAAHDGRGRGDGRAGHEPRCTAGQQPFYVNVVDNGLGIDPEHHSAVFQMFRRFHASSTSGSGLGLYLVLKHVENLGGTITFASAPGTGTAFFVKFPIAHERTASRGSPAEPCGSHAMHIDAAGD